jgi:hypothetical protein
LIEDASGFPPAGRYLFLHVPKTAGSTFRNIVNRNFGAEATVENPLMSEQVYSTEQIETMFAHYPYRFLMGHVFRLQPSLEAFGGTIQLISFVRDPVAKARSAYSYLAGRELTRADHPVKTKSFVEMCRLVIDSGVVSSFLLDSPQLDWLVGRTDAALEDVAPSVQAGRLLLFPTEDFDLACVLLETLFPDDFKDCSYGARVNVSAAAEDAGGDENDAAAEGLPWVAADRALHRLAKSNIDALAERVLGDPSERAEALAELARRCAERGPPTGRTRGKLSRLFAKTRRRR